MLEYSGGVKARGELKGVIFGHKRGIGCLVLR